MSNHIETSGVIPSDFAWGTAVSAHQVEGGNTNDWTQWENTHQPPELRSGRADNFWEQYPRDFSMASEQLHNNAIRLSVEWSRIYSEKGKVDQGALDHYVKMLESAGEHNLDVMVTLHHFTNPTWFAEKGGWKKKENVPYFLEFVKTTEERLRPLTKWWTTVNEPDAYTVMSFLAGQWPPQEHNPVHAMRVYRNMAEAHKRSYGILKEGNPTTPVGTAIHMHEFRGLPPINRVIEALYNYGFISMSGSRNAHDFIGVNYYRPLYLVPTGESRSLEKNDFGWNIDPRGFYHVLMRTWQRYHLPIMVTENGIADAADTKREKFLKEHIQAMMHAMHDGANVRGYFHWSLMDNFEWAEGFKMKFGLVAVDFQDPNLPRTIRKSAQVYGEICRNPARIDK